MIRVSRSHKLCILLLAAALLPVSTIAQTPPAAPAPVAPATPATPATPANNAADPAVVGDHNNRLSDRIPPEQQLQLQAGEDKFPGRYIADLTPDHRGAVIILHDSGQHQSWPFTVAALLDELPQYGWNTLAIDVPPPAQDAPGATPAPPPPAPAAAAPATAPAAAAPPPAAPSTSLVTGSEDGVEKQTQARIDAAVKKLVELHGKSQPTVLIGFGSGAWRAVEFARKQAEGNGARRPDPLVALVIIDPRNRLPATKVDLPTLLPTTELAALDIVQSSEPLVRADAEARRRAVLKQRGRVYQQLALPPLAAGDAIEQTVLTRRIRGWMQQHVELPSPAKPPQGNGAPPKP
jgi:hypothetical protein